MLPCRHVYVPYAEAARRPNIVVDGASNEGSVLTLSHWPKSGTPWPLKADTSAGIVFNYLDDPAWHRAAPAVTNNHFDEDGLVGLYCLIEPEHALERRALLIEDIEGHRALWAEEDALLEASERAFASGEATLEERAEVDLAIVRVPAGWPDRPAHRFAKHLDVAIHRMAVFNRTSCNRIATLCGDWINVSYRYESWVQTVSHRPPPRIDLSPLAARLSEVDSNSWRFDGVEAITPALRPESNHSALDHERFLDALVSALHDGAKAWDPYDDQAAWPSHAGDRI
jgi:hypothetical protein